MNRRDFQVRRRAFRLWQRRPHEVAPMVEQQHRCSTCGTEYVGNYCPRCGQSSKIGRYSFKRAFLLFLDVWGLGNRGMFRTLRDLLLRPGYMIRDYLSGMQMAYFPPFKMFFLLSTLSLAVQGGLNIMGKNSFKKEEVVMQVNESGSATTETVENVTDATVKATNIIMEAADFLTSFPTLFSLFSLVLLSAFLYPFFRKCPAIPDLRYSELVVATVYMANMYSIVSVMMDFFCIYNPLLRLLVLLLALLPLKQLSGYSKRKTFLYTLTATLLMSITIGLLLSAAILIVRLFV
ncbi:MAG: DUF3667 domain-containing protein [Prevotella sp.]|nr:DUF3667 domain-containing protein [Prevotella sp.]